MRIRVLLGALVALCLLAGCRAERPTFRIGYMICNSLEETRERFAPLTAYLSEKSGARFEGVYLDTGDVEPALAQGELDFTHTNSLLYVILREHHALQLVAAEKKGAFGVLTRGAIIARRGAGLESLEDLRGKRFVFGPSGRRSASSPSTPCSSRPGSTRRPTSGTTPSPTAPGSTRRSSTRCSTARSTPGPLPSSTWRR